VELVVRVFGRRNAAVGALVAGTANDSIIKFEAGMRAANRLVSNAGIDTVHLDGVVTGIAKVRAFVVDSVALVRAVRNPEGFLFGALKRVMAALGIARRRD